MLNIAQVVLQLLYIEQLAHWAKIEQLARWAKMQHAWLCHLALENKYGNFEVGVMVDFDPIYQEYDLKQQ